MKKLLGLAAGTVCLGLGLLSAQNLGQQTTTTSIPTPSPTLATLATMDVNALIADDLSHHRSFDYDE